MPRKRRDEEIVLSFWKQFARDASCPWALRVYCVNCVAKYAGVLAEFPPIPGTYRPAASVTPSPEVSKEAPTPVEAAAAVAVADVKHFLSQLGGANGDS